MEARRRWATGVVVLVAVAAGGVGGLYLWREVVAMNADAAHGDGGAVGDASGDARAGRAKPKAAKRRARPGKPRTGPKPSGAPSGLRASDEEQAADDSADEGPEPFQPPFRGRGPAGRTYEAAIASSRQEIAIGSKGEPDLTDEQLTRPMHDGAFVGECGAPDRMKVTVKVAVQRGRAVGVSVSTSPPDPDVAGCIDRYVRTFAWPASAKMDSFVTTY